MKAVLTISLILVFLVPAFAQRDSELYGYVRYANNSAARGVIVSIGNFSVATDANGYYKMGYLRPGLKVVLITPPGKETRSFKVLVGSSPTQRDFIVDW